MNCNASNSSSVILDEFSEQHQHQKSTIINVQLPLFGVNNIHILVGKMGKIRVLQNWYVSAVQLLIFFLFITVYLISIEHGILQANNNVRQFNNFIFGVRRLTKKYIINIKFYQSKPILSKQILILLEDINLIHGIVILRVIL